MQPLVALSTAGILVLGLSACVSKTYPVTVGSSPALGVYTSYEDKIPGRYALYVKAEKLMQTIKFSGSGCGAHNYPTDARAAFENSALQTLQHLMERVETIPEPIARPELDARGYNGMILIEVDDLDVVVLTIPGLLYADAIAGAKIDVDMSVEGKEKHLLGIFASSADEHRIEMGRYCSGGEMAIGTAIEGAITKVLKRLTVLLMNAADVLKQDSPPAEHQGYPLKT